MGIMTDLLLFAISGWWYTYPLKNMKVSWYDYNQYIWKIKVMFQTTNQL